MTAEFFDEKGDLVEAYTEEELKSKLESESARIIEETNAEKQIEIDAANEKLAEAENESFLKEKSQVR